MTRSGLKISKFFFFFLTNCFYCYVKLRFTHTQTVWIIKVFVDEPSFSVFTCSLTSWLIFQWKLRESSSVIDRNRSAIYSIKWKNRKYFKSLRTYCYSLTCRSQRNGSWTRSGRGSRDRWSSWATRESIRVNGVQLLLSMILYTLLRLLTILLLNKQIDSVSTDESNGLVAPWPSFILKICSINLASMI